MQVGIPTQLVETNFFGGYSAGCANRRLVDYNVMFGLGAGKCPTAGNSRWFCWSLSTSSWRKICAGNAVTSGCDRILMRRTHVAGKSGGSTVLTTCGILDIMQVKQLPLVMAKNVCCIGCPSAMGSPRLHASIT